VLTEPSPGQIGGTSNRYATILGRGKVSNNMDSRKGYWAQDTIEEGRKESPTRKERLEEQRTSRYDA